MWILECIIASTHSTFYNTHYTPPKSPHPHTITGHHPSSRRPWINSLPPLPHLYYNSFLPAVWHTTAFDCFDSFDPQRIPLPSGSAEGAWGCADWQFVSRRLKSRKGRRSSAVASLHLRSTSARWGEGKASEKWPLFEAWADFCWQNGRRWHVAWRSTASTASILLATNY